MYIHPMLEWDEAKRRRTLDERGIDFADMAALFDGRPVLERRDDRSDHPELRYVRIGRVRGRLFVVVWTPRGQNARIISARKANAREARAIGRRL